MQDLNFKVYVGTRSEEVQKHLFSLGAKWHGTMWPSLNRPFLFVKNGILTHTEVFSCFQEDESPELSIDQVLALKNDDQQKPETLHITFSREDDQQYENRQTGNIITSANTYTTAVQGETTNKKLLVRIVSLALKSPLSPVEIAIINETFQAPSAMPADFEHNDY